MGDDDYSSLETEIETLKAIYIHELEVNHDDRGRPSCVIVHLYPATADNVTEQFVRLSLILRIPPEYPLEIPEICIRNTRGLSDEEIESIYQATQTLAEEHKGNALLFELIEVAKEHLTSINIPSCECAICLYGFVNDDVLTKTECFHYFHSHCLARYVHHTLKKRKSDKNEEINSEQSELYVEIPCPVCRLPISFPPSDEKFPPPVESENIDISISNEQRKLQEEMQELYFKQKEKGGIIDLEAEKNKFLLEISTVPNLLVNNDVETSNQQIQQYIVKTEHKDPHLENIVKTDNIGPEMRCRNVENHLGESSFQSNTDKNKISKSFGPKQQSIFLGQGENDSSPEENLECITEPRDNSKSQKNESKKHESMFRSDTCTEYVANNIQQEAISHDHGYRNIPRGKVIHRGSDRRHFRENRYPKQGQNRTKHAYDKKFQPNEYVCRNETAKCVSRQLSCNYVSGSSDIGMNKFNSKRDVMDVKQTETDGRSESLNTNIYLEREHEIRLKYTKSQRTERRNELSRDYKTGFIKKGGHLKRAEKEGRQHSGKYEENYRSEQKYRNNFQKHVSMENTQNKEHVFQDIKENRQFNKSPMTEMKKKENLTVKILHRSISYEKDVFQNQDRDKQSNMEDLKYTKRDGRRGNCDRKYNNHEQKLQHNRANSSDNRNLRQDSMNDNFENRNTDQVCAHSKDMNRNADEQTTIQKVSRQIESNETDFIDILQPVIDDDGEESMKEEKFKNVNIHRKNNYRGRFNNRRGFHGRANDRQYRYSYEDKCNYNGRFVSEQLNFEHKPHRGIDQTASKNKINGEIKLEETEQPLKCQETTIQVDSQLKDAKFEDILESSKKGDNYEERCKNPNVHDWNNYGGRPRSRRGFHNRSNTRNRYGSVDGDKYNGKSFSEPRRYENKHNSKLSVEQMKQTQDSNNLILTEVDDSEVGKNILKQTYSRDNVLYTLPTTESAKASTKHRNLYFYPKGRCNYHNNRTLNEDKYLTQEKYRDSVSSSVSKAETIYTTCKTESKEQLSHR